MKSSKAVKPLLRDWNGKFRQNLPYILPRSTILRLVGSRHDKSILQSLIDTMSRHPQHLFIYTSEDVEDLDVHLDNVIPILHVSSRVDVEEKYEDFLSLNPPISAISIWAGETFVPSSEFEWVLLSGNKYTSVRSTMSNMAEAGIPVYLERFQQKKYSVPAELNKRQICSDLSLYQHKCFKEFECRLSRRESSCN